jgi:beta-phosphoglucomutase-like phosphatase (HAD superfamily)
MQTKLLLLDFDGTLANTGRANAVSYIETLREEGIEIGLEEYRERYFGMRCPEFLASLGFDDPQHRARIRQRKVDIYPSHFDLVTLNTPLWNFVQAFRATGGRAWIVSTGHPDNIANVMHHLGIEDSFDGILTGNEVTHPKPHPEAFLKVMEIESVKPEETLIFEDSEIGLEAAKASGAAYIKVELPF